MKSGEWVIEKDLCWTLPNPFIDLPSLTTSFKKILESSNLLIFKGDLNYRKLTGDFDNGDHTVPLEKLLAPLTKVVGSRRLPLLALRTCKSGTVVGLEQGKSQELDMVDAGWRENGKFGMVQFIVL